ncbi:MAG: fructosamine kinase family protein [Dolichospermum sp.]
MHKFSTNKGFGWDINNTSGSTPQINNLHTSWFIFHSKTYIPSP